MSSPVIEKYGWNIYYHPVFDQQFEQQLEFVESLNRKLSEGTITQESYTCHSEVKLLGTLIDLIEEKIPSDPLAKRFLLQDDLKLFSRVKHLGLPSRYRLFFKAFPATKRIVILWLGHPRRAGDKKRDCYEVFKKMVGKGQFPLAFEELVQKNDLILHRRQPRQAVLIAYVEPQRVDWEYWEEVKLY